MHNNENSIVNAQRAIGAIENVHGYVNIVIITPYSVLISESAISLIESKVL